MLVVSPTPNNSVNGDLKSNFEITKATNALRNMNATVIIRIFHKLMLNTFVLKKCTFFFLSVLNID